MTEADFRTLVELAPDVIAILDRDRRYLYINPAIEAAGVPMSAFLGNSNDDVMPPPDAARWRAAIDDVLATGTTRDLECVVETPRGPREFAAIVSRLPGDRVCVVSRDVTDLRAALDNARLFEAERRARQAAEEARDRTRRLQELTVALSRAIERQQVIATFVDAGRGALGASAGFAWLLRDDDTLELTGTKTDGSSGVVDRYRTISLSAELPLCAAIRTATPLIFESFSALASAYPLAANPSPYRAWAIVPFVVDGRGVGATAFSFEHERTFSAEDREMLVAMTGQASLALERARLVEAHRRSEEQLRYALTAARAATWSLDIPTMRAVRDDSYRILVGQDARNATADFMAIHPDDREIARRAFQAALDTDVPYDPEVRVRRDDGTYMWVRAHARVTRDANGKPQTMAGVIVDIDEVKHASLRAEEDRRTNETMHRLVSSFASELDHDRLVQLMTEELTKLVGADVGVFRADADDPHVTRVEHPSYLGVPVVARTGEVYGTFAFSHPEGGRFTEEHARIVGAVANQAAVALENARLYKSVREHKEQLEHAVEHARLADRRKDEFLAMLGHELRNPLAPITTALELMEMKGTTTISRETDVIRRQVEHLSRLIDDLLDISRITRGTIPLVREVVALDGVLGRAVEMASPLLEKRRQHLALDVPKDVHVDVDPTRLAQVFQNVIVNASKYSDAGSSIEIEARADDARVRIVVRDHGAGIAPELIANVFEPFVQGPRTIDRAEGGLGIGLAIAKSLCELHGGKIEVASEGVGKGSTFTITLPRAQPKTAPLAERPAPKLGNGTRILVVDDNVDAAFMLRELLRVVGHEPEVAHDGPSALEIARSFEPQVAVLDIGLPVMNGYELARQLREHFGTERLRLIALTGYGQETDRARAKEVGFDHHMIKPVELDKLLELLATRDVDVGKPE